MNYVPEPENSALLRCALGVFRKFSRFPEALRLALMLNDMELVEDIFTSCKDVYVGKKSAEEEISSWVGACSSWLELEGLFCVLSGWGLSSCDGSLPQGSAEADGIHARPARGVSGAE